LATVVAGFTNGEPAMGSVVFDDFLLFSCVAAFMAGLVLAAAGLMV
jgi:hypothetical protein